MEVVRTLWCPKEGSTDAQYEDAFCVGEGVAAVADGASAAVYARQWAGLLVEEFARGEPIADRDAPFWERVRALGTRWSTEVGDGKGGAWWAEEKLPEGSQASLLVVRFDGDRLHAASVGDVCAFVIRDGKFKWAFPLKKSAAFGNHPSLVPTDPARLPRKPPVVRFSPSLQPGDRLFLCTDAIAQWFLSRHEKKAHPWDELPTEETGFRAWVQARRDDDSLKNDDVTLIEIVTA
jgi:hypothetical protein